MSRLRDKRRRHDHFFKKAKKGRYASRAIFKLETIDQRFRLLKPGGRVLDLGCAPGSWLQYAARRVGARGAVVGIDRLEVEIALPGQVRILRGDVQEPELADLCARLCEDVDAFDVVLSDMAPNTTGIRHADVARSVALVERVLAIAQETLQPGGSLVAKIFVGEGFDELLRQVKARFRRVKMVKPDSSRKESPEQYIVAQEKRESPLTS